MLVTWNTAELWVFYPGDVIREGGRGSRHTSKLHILSLGLSYLIIQGWGQGHIVLGMGGYCAGLGFVQGRLLGELGAQVLEVRLTPEAERMSWTTDNHPNRIFLKTIFGIAISTRYQTQSKWSMWH